MAGKYDGIERYIFADAYNLFLKYRDIPDETYYWEALADEANVLNFKYKNHPFARAIIVAVIVQIEHKVTDKKRDGLTHEQWESKLDLAHKMGW